MTEPRRIIDINKDKKISFMEMDDGYLIELTSDGELYREGRLITTDEELVDAFICFKNIFGQTD